MKLFITWWLIVLSGIMLIFYVGGCVNVNNPDVSTVDYRALVKFVNLSKIGTGINVNVDGSAIVSSLTYTSYSAYQDLASGTRLFSFTYAGTSPAIQDTFHYSVAPNYKFTYFFVSDPTAGDLTRNYFLIPERQTYSGIVAYVPNNILVRFINFSNDTSASVNGGVQFHLIYSTTDTTTDLLVFKGVSPYYQVALSNSANYLVMSADTSIHTPLIPSTPVSTTQGRFSVVLYGFQGTHTLQTQVYKED
jgi:hypothetical protein